MSEIEIDDLGRDLLTFGEPVDTGHWQSLKNVPQTKTIELRNTTFYMNIPESVSTLQHDTMCNLPWAEEQFQERVSGVPLNPGESYKKWPWYRGNVPTHQREEKFSHTYMERFWPRYANGGDDPSSNKPRANLGIRYRYGDLNDVVALLAREPYTRQAYLPVFFPEDTGAHTGERIPCTLGYHFLLREGKLHINYFIRSCDYLRHFRDDVYLAGRLCQWLIDTQLRKLEVTILDDQSNDVPGPVPNIWHDVVPGTLTMFMSSLHVFEGDLPKMVRDYG